MKKAISVFACLALCGTIFTVTVHAEAMSNQELSDRVQQLESKLGGEGGWENVIDEGGLALSDYVDGMGAYVIVGLGPVTLIGEYITALDEIEWLDENDDLILQDEIAAWNLEVGYTFAIAEKEATVAAALQGTDEAENMLPETRYLGSLGIGIFESTTLAFEYAHDEYENDDEEDAFTAQLAIEF